jgi:hypothetical protein
VPGGGGAGFFYVITAAQLGYAYALSGRLPEGAVLIEEALADPEATAMHRPLLLAYLGEAHLLAGRRHDAVAVAGRALDLAHRQKEWGNEAWVLRLLADIAAHADPPTRRQPGKRYNRALARADELGMRPFAAIVTLVWGGFTAALAIRSTLKDTWRPP